MYRIIAYFSCAAFILLAGADGFCPSGGSFFSHRAETPNVLGYKFYGRGSRERRHPARNVRTRLSESIRQNRDKINRATSRLREAVRSGDHELAERLKAFILHLRKRDPQFSTQDALDDALAKGLFSTAAKLKLKLTEINQNPFRQGLLSDADQDDATSNSGSSGDVAEDMSWGFDQSFMGNDGEGTGAEDDEDYDDI